jgi:hypothetical protein
VWQAPRDTLCGTIRPLSFPPFSVVSHPGDWLEEALTVEVLQLDAAATAAGCCVLLRVGA